MISPLDAYRYQKSAKYNIARGVSRTSTASEMEFFIIIVNSFKPLIILIELSVLDVEVLDPHLITARLLMMSNKLIFCRLLKYEIIALVNDSKVETSWENVSLY